MKIPGKKITLNKEKHIFFFAGWFNITKKTEFTTLEHQVQNQLLKGIKYTKPELKKKPSWFKELQL